MKRIFHRIGYSYLFWPKGFQGCPVCVVCRKPIQATFLAVLHGVSSLFVWFAGNQSRRLSWRFFTECRVCVVCKKLVQATFLVVLHGVSSLCGLQETNPRDFPGSSSQHSRLCLQCKDTLERRHVSEKPALD